MKTIYLIFVIMLSLFVIHISVSYGWDQVCIDPGHGGTDAGCIGRVYGVKEKDVNFGVGLEAWHYFGLANWEPIMMRYEDIDIDRPHRANIDKNACKILENNLSWCKAIIQI
jgi:hypothetical protein